MSFAESLKIASEEIWERSYEHPFVQELGKGTLGIDSFQFYLVQDYLDLLEYAKVFALGALKSPSEELMLRFTQAQYGILQEEMGLHRQYMKKFQISEDALISAEPSLFNQAYTANMLAIGQSGDLAELLGAVFPCAWSYYDFGCRLKKDFAEELENNPYASWIEMYSSLEFYRSFDWFSPVMDELCAGKTESEKKRIEKIFIRSMEFEYYFWEMSYRKQMS